jgi:membrane-associated phospholipid phosphatase
VIYKYQSLLFVLVLFLTLLIFFVLDTLYFPIDLAVTLFLQKFNLSPLMEIVSWFGYGWFKYLALFVLAGAFALRKYLKESIMILFSTLGAQSISMILKNLIDRPRPDPNLINQLEILTKSDSFPSGHVLFYLGFFGFTLFLSQKLINKKPFKYAVSSFCLFFLITVGPSRIYLGAHWATDVIGGYLAGAIWLIVSIMIYKKWKYE